MAEGELKLKKTISGKKQEAEKKISSVKLNTFFSELEKLGFYGRQTLTAVPVMTLLGRLWLTMKGKRRDVLGFLALNRILGRSF
jgi:hypothetical protein